MNHGRNPAPSVVDFASLISWYQSHCDGTWEHTYGIKLETLDNPGWRLTVDLIQTDLQGRKMEELVEGCSPAGQPRSPRWIHCLIRNNQFQGACDPLQIDRLFGVFNQLLTTG